MKLTDNNNSNLPTHKAHLDKTFLEELNHKLWTTKGARFIANERLLKQTNLSNTTLALLSMYLIIAGLLTIYPLTENLKSLQSYISIGTTAISILVLVLSQIENAGDYKLRAHKFHDCALELSSLYNEIRIFKTLNSNPKEEDKKDFCEKINVKYQKVLHKYENHKSIDHDLFRVQNRHFYELKTVDVWLIKFNIYIETSLLYHLLIAMPILIGWYVIH